jgi:hypothetical protein
MGGYGSGWQGAKKATVEGSLVLTASSLVRKRALVAGAWTSGSWCWGGGLRASTFMGASRGTARKQPRR